jgi:hypothetical protein
VHKTWGSNQMPASYPAPSSILVSLLDQAKRGAGRTGEQTKRFAAGGRLVLYLGGRFPGSAPDQWLDPGESSLAGSRGPSSCHSIREMPGPASRGPGRRSGDGVRHAARWIVGMLTS